MVCKLLLFTDSKSHTGFVSISTKPVTLNGRCFALSHPLSDVKVADARPMLSATEM